MKASQEDAAITTQARTIKVTQMTQSNPTRRFIEEFLFVSLVFGICALVRQSPMISGFTEVSLPLAMTISLLFALDGDRQFSALYPAALGSWAFICAEEAPLVFGFEGSLKGFMYTGWVLILSGAFALVTIHREDLASQIGRVVTLLVAFVGHGIIAAPGMGLTAFGMLSTAGLSTSLLCLGAGAVLLRNAATLAVEEAEASPETTEEVNPLWMANAPVAHAFSGRFEI